MELSLDPSSRAQAYRDGDPFPHAVLDGLFPSAVLDEVLAEFPGPGSLDWHRFNNERERKLGMKTGDGLPSRTLNLLYYLNSAPMVRFLETLTGIQGLVPDPYYEGGGLHQILPGGYLKIHADFNWHHRLRLHRRINMLIYLNKDWKEEYGGHLELWDARMEACRKRILPVFGRAVVFNTTDFAYHGHPDPLACPEGMSRKSLALYYYSSTRPRNELTRAHSTLFRRRLGEDWAEPPVPGGLRRHVPAPVLEAARALRSLLRPR